jgi:elongator complex protein 6
MTTNSRIPPLLSPYIVSPPKDSLLLLTSTLGTSANWILTRYLCSLLAGDAGKSGSSAPTPQEYAELSEAKSRLSATSGLSGENEEYAVVLASWARDGDFWKVEGRKAAVCTQIFKSLMACELALSRRG